jgi:hypothetical protein
MESVLSLPFLEEPATGPASELDLTSPNLPLF